MYKRYLFNELIKPSGKHFIGIVGPRGVGKTILLKQLANYYENSFYISVDTLDENLFETIKLLSETLNIKNFFLDEVHTYNNFDKELKMIYDVFESKDIKLFFNLHEQPANNSQNPIVENVVNLFFLLYNLYNLIIKNKVDISSFFLFLVKMLFILFKRRFPIK